MLTVQRVELKSPALLQYTDIASAEGPAVNSAQRLCATKPDYRVLQAMWGKRLWTEREITML